jgi:excisionase family DNA binding protein
MTVRKLAPLLLMTLPGCLNHLRRTQTVCRGHDEVEMGHPAEYISTDERPRARKIPSFCRYASIGRTKVYDDIKAGKLRAVKAGRSTLILHEDGEAYLNALPAVEVKTHE